MSADPVRELHNAAAASANSAEASTRPAHTTGFELAVMRRDVLRKLRVERTSSVLEIGCGTGELAIPLARKAARFHGIDLADRAVEVLRSRLEDEGLAGRASVECANVLALSPQELRARGPFDRVLVYAALHYARTDEEAAAFLARAVGCLSVGGRALIGNLPLQELDREAQPLLRPEGGRARETAGWLRASSALRDRPLAWKLAAVAYMSVKGRVLQRRTSSAPAAWSLPPGYCVDLTLTKIEAWLDGLPCALSYRWKRPAVASPLSIGRADLVVIRDG